MPCPLVKRRCPVGLSRGGARQRRALAPLAWGLCPLEVPHNPPTTSHHLRWALATWGPPTPDGPSTCPPAPVPPPALSLLDTPLRAAPVEVGPLGRQALRQTQCTGRHCNAPAAVGARAPKRQCSITCPQCHPSPLTTATGTPRAHWQSASILGNLHTLDILLIMGARRPQRLRQRRFHGSRAAGGVPGFGLQGLVAVERAALRLAARALRPAQQRHP